MRGVGPHGGASPYKTLLRSPSRHQQVQQQRCEIKLNKLIFNFLLH